MFTYELDLKRIRATVTREAAVAGKELFTAAYGYHEAAVTDLRGLGAFAARVRDLTYAAKADKGLILGGRTLLSRKYRTLRVEDIAAIWQAQGQLGRAGGRDSVGFSLDPVYDFDALTKWFKAEVKPVLLEIAKQKNSPIAAADIEDAEARLTVKFPEPLEALLGKVRDAGKERKKPEWVALGQVWSRELSDRQFQIARYDGNLQGTEIGMILFYTDLLAKFWCAVDLGYSAPVHDIAGFRTRPIGGNPPHFLPKSLENPNTRVWFGVDPGGYQLLPGKDGIAFARRAARIYSASSDTLKPGVEEPTSPASEAVFGWWNDHFEEVARYEPEYERLNEFMKWSLVVAWLYHGGQQDRLAGLDKVPVDRSAWFPKWARGNTDLRFAQWSKVGFHPKGYKETTTEALPRLKSSRFSDYGGAFPTWQITGGVSGASPSRDIGGRAALPSGQPTPGPIGRGWTPEAAGAGGKTAGTHRGIRYEFDGNGRVRLIPNPKAPLVGRDAEARTADLNRQITAGPDGISLRTDLGGRPQDRLEVRVNRDGVVVTQQPGEVAAGNEVARDVSGAWFRDEVPWVALMGHRDVRYAIALPDGSVLVKPRGSDTYLKLTPEEKPTAALPAGADGRTSSPLVRSKTVTTTRVEPEQVAGLIGDAEYLRVELPVSPLERAAIDAGAGGPPKPPRNGVEVTFAGGGEPDPIHGIVDADGHSVFVAVKDLPPAYRKNPARLIDRFRVYEAQDARHAVEVARKKGEEKAEVALRGPAAAEKPAVPDLVRDATVALRADRPSDALRLLDGIPGDALGPTGRLVRAAAHLKLSREDSAAAAVGLEPGTKPDRESCKALLDEVAARMADPKTPAAEKEAVLRLVASRTRDLTVVPADGQPVLGASARPRPEKPDPEDVTPESIVYAELGTGVATTDWVAEIKKVNLGPALKENKAELVVLYGSAIPRFGPERVGYTGPNQKQRWAKRVQVGTAAGGGLAAALAAGLFGGEDGGDCDDDDDDDDPFAPKKPQKKDRKEPKPCPPVYLIRAKAK